MQRTYDKAYLIKCLLRLVGIMVLMMFTGGAGFVVVVPFVLMAMVSNRHEDLLFWLITTGTLVVGNSFLFPKTVVFFIAQRAILGLLAMALATQVFGRRLPRMMSPLIWLVIYILYMIIPSVAGWCPIVSLLKISLFLVCFLAYFGVSVKVTNGELALGRLRSILLAFSIFFIGGSILLIPFPAISQLQGDAYMDAIIAGKEVTSLFTGMTCQSQCLGPVVASIACILLGDLLFGVKKADMLYISLLILCPVLIYKTSSRTAAGTYLAGMLSVLWCFMWTREIASRWKTGVMNVAILFGMVLCIGFACSSGARDSAARFLMKWGGQGMRASDVDIESVILTRQGKFEEGIENFLESPVIGNGFQVEPGMQGYRFSSMKEMLSAPVEKSVWISAVLEEGGVIGFAIFSIFIVFAIIKTRSSGAPIGACALLTFIISNLGEFTFFSMSYTGGFMWAMVFLGLTFDIARRKQLKTLRYSEWGSVFNGRF